MISPNEKYSGLVQLILNVVQPEKIILFGSTARGESKKNSDIDILVVAKNGTHRRKLAQMLNRALIDYNDVVDIVVCNEEDLIKYSNTYGLIYREVIKDGHELYAA